MEELQDFAMDLKDILDQIADSIVTCDKCGIVLACPKCANYACTGGYGTVNGEQCDMCPAVYAIMAQMKG